jgi:hypothetical protein
MVGRAMTGTDNADALFFRAVDRDRHPNIQVARIAEPRRAVKMVADQVGG